MYFHDILIFVATGMVNCDANKDPVALKAANKSAQRLGDAADANHGDWPA